MNIDEIQTKIKLIMQNASYELGYCGNTSYYRGQFSAASRACTAVGISLNEQRLIEKEWKERGVADRVKESKNERT